MGNLLVSSQIGGALTSPSPTSKGEESSLTTPLAQLLPLHFQDHLQVSLPLLGAASLNSGCPSRIPTGWPLHLLRPRPWVLYLNLLGRTLLLKISGDKGPPCSPEEHAMEENKFQLGFSTHSAHFVSLKLAGLSLGRKRVLSLGASKSSLGSQGRRPLPWTHPHLPGAS